MQRYQLDEHELLLIPDFLPPEKAEQMHRRLTGELPWHQGQVRLFGREHPIPRQQCWVASQGLTYRYSGQTLTPHDWPAWLAPLAEEVGNYAGETFNSVLCNRYRNGQDSIGWHSDNEPELGPAPVIASYSLGETRRFQFRHRHDHSRKLTLELSHNSLLIMPAGLQSLWQHQLPKTRRPRGPRINLTFRRVEPG